MLSKKVVSLFASVIVLVSASCPAFAASYVKSPQSAPIQVDYVYTNMASSTLRISGGIATIIGFVQRTTSGKKVYVESTLQRYSGGFWYAIKSWSKSSTDYAASVSAKYKVSSGRYRVATYYSVTGANGTESGTVYSKTVTC